VGDDRYYPHPNPPPDRGRTIAIDYFRFLATEALRPSPEKLKKERFLGVALRTEARLLRNLLLLVEARFTLVLFTPERLRLELARFAADFFLLELARFVAGLFLVELARFAAALFLVELARFAAGFFLVELARFAADFFLLETVRLRPARLFNDRLRLEAALLVTLFFLDFTAALLLALPEPLFLPPLDNLFTVAQARRLATDLDLPLVLYPAAICFAWRFCF
jgi:hypothetical protein